MAFDRLDAVQRRALRRHQLMLHRQKPFGDDVQARARHQVVDVGDSAGDRVLDQDHAECGFAAGDGREGILEGRAGHRLVVGIGLAAARGANWRPSSPWNDNLLFGHARFRYALARRPSQRPDCRATCGARFEILGRVDAERHDFDDRHVDPHAGLERAQLLELLARFERRGRQASTKRSSAARR